MGDTNSADIYIAKINAAKDIVIKLIDKGIVHLANIEDTYKKIYKAIDSSN